ncbi:MAG: putative lipid II flippase FtsW [Clostridia bacterium]|nr:putative lipid II flippase FtsW [Clostridia bacterium]
MDMGFLVSVMLLLIVGLIMVFSASYPTAYYKTGNGFSVIGKQLLWAVLGVGAMLFTSTFNYNNYKKFIGVILGGCVLLLVAVLVIGNEVNGAKRWLGYGGASFQPSEAAKIGIIIYLAYSMSNIKDKIKQFKYLVRYAVVLGGFMLLLLLEPHFSVCIIIGLTAVIMMLAAGARIRYFALAAAPVAFAGWMIAIFEPYRLKRLTIFWDPFKDRLGAGWQIIQSLYAIGSGGLFGVGFGNSRQKFMYVSEPQNDFIFAIVCEELGLIGALAILALFGFMIYRGIKIAMNAPDTFSCLLVTGIVSLVGVQAVLNIAVVTSSIPTTGIPLPFFSAGGSSLVFLMAAMGMVLNVSKYKRQPKA